VRLKPQPSVHAHVPVIARKRSVVMAQVRHPGEVREMRRARGNRIDVRPNWKEASGTVDDWSGRPAMPGGED
jgi:hypothetical protein